MILLIFEAMRLQPHAGVHAAAAHGFTIASRDTSAFDAAGLRVINPWS